MNIAIVTTAKTDQEARSLLKKARNAVQEIGVNKMAKKSMIIKALRKPKYMTRRVNRCRICGRPQRLYERFSDVQNLF